MNSQFNLPDDVIDREWVAEAQRRLREIKTRQVKPIPAEDVFADIEKRFEK
jgi:hypothetical protein